jgi:hypothetical protein
MFDVSRYRSLHCALVNVWLALLSAMGMTATNDTPTEVTRKLRNSRLLKMLSTVPEDGVLHEDRISTHVCTAVAPVPTARVLRPSAKWMTGPAGNSDDDVMTTRTNNVQKTKSARSLCTSRRLLAWFDRSNADVLWEVCKAHDVGIRKNWCPRRCVPSFLSF